MTTPPPLSCPTMEALTDAVSSKKEYPCKMALMWVQTWAWQSLVYVRV